MQGGSDDRAVAVQVGAIILFAFLIIAMAGYQASVVPNQNNEIEFNHNQQVQGQIEDVEGTIGSMPAVADQRTTTVDLSTSYPARTLFVNPPTPTGRLRTVGTDNDDVAIEIENAVATNGDMADYWDGSPRDYSTGALAFNPNYNVYTGAPRTFVENSLVYNDFGSEKLTVNSQSLFDGDDITLIAVRGSYDEQGGTASVRVRPVSASTTTTTVTNPSSEQVTFRIVSRLGANKWRSILQDDGEFSDQNSGGHVESVQQVDTVLADGETLNVIEFQMEADESYRLQVAGVGVGQLSAGEQTTNATYAVMRTDSVTTDENVDATVTVEIRDEYGNPKGDARVNATVDGAGDGSQGSIADTERTTDEDGLVTFTYETTDNVDGDAKTDNVRVSLDSDPSSGFDESTKEDVETTVTVKNTDSSGTGGGGGSGTDTFEFSGPSWNSPIVQGEVLAVETDVTNTGKSEGTQIVSLSFDGTEVDDKPVTLGAGETKTVTLSYDSDGTVPGDYESTLESDDDTKSRTVTVEDPPSSPYFTVKIGSTNGPVFEGETLEVDAVVENVGDTSDTQSITLDFDGTQVDSRSRTLDPGEKRTITLTYDTTDGDAGENVGIVVASEDTKANGEVTVEETQAEYDVFVRDTNSPVAAGETLDVVIDVKNTGNGAGEKKVTLDFDQDGNIDDQQFVTLDAGEEKQITLQYDVPSDQSTGEYTVEAASPDTSHKKDVTVQQPTDFSVSIDDSNSPIVEGENYNVVVTVKNVGGSGTETIELDVGTTVGVDDSRDVTLGNSESKTITLTYASTDGDAGSYSPTVSAESDSAGTSLTILEDPNFQVTSVSTNDPITEAETLQVTADIENTGDVEGTQTVELDFDNDGSIEDTVDLTLGGGATETVTLTYDAQQGDKGNRDVAVSTEDDIETTTVEVREDMADRVAYVSGSANKGGDDEAVIFELTNDGDHDVVITEFSVEGNFDGVETEDLPVQIDKNNGGDRYEVDFDVGTGEDGYVDREKNDPFIFGPSYPFDDPDWDGTEPRIASGGDRGVVTIEQFENDGGKVIEWNSVSDGSESDHTLKITLTFEDGSTEVIYIDAEDPSS